MAGITKDKKTSTGSPPKTPFQQTYTGSPQFSASTNTNSNDDAITIMDMVIKSLVTMDDLRKDIIRVEKEQDRTRNFYTGITKLARTSRIALIILMIAPVFQLILCTAIVYYLGIQDQLPGLLIWVLGGVSLLSIIEVVITAIKYFTLENKVNELEKKVEKLEDK